MTSQNRALILLIAFAIALSLTAALGIASSVYGPHSTPGFRLAIANCPGFLAAAWVSPITGDNVITSVIGMLVNWAFYFYVIQGAVALKRKFSR